MKIKTIVEPYAKDFDIAVNAALDEGYQLVRRDVHHDHHYAQLEKYDEPAPLNPIIAAHAVHEECMRHDSCRDCPLDGICDNASPAEWFCSEDTDR